MMEVKIIMKYVAYNHNYKFQIRFLYYYIDTKIIGGLKILNQLKYLGYLN